MKTAAARQWARVAVASVLFAAIVGGAPTASGARPDRPVPAGRQLTGILGGDASLEGGCAWLERPEARYEVRWPEGYRVEFDPLRLTGPSGEVVAMRGDRVTVRGVRVRDAVTVCQVGPVFDADAVVT